MFCIYGCDRLAVTRFGTELKLDSVGQLTAIITREHYIKASCDPDYMLVDAGI